MAGDSSDRPDRTIQPLDADALEARLREAAKLFSGVHGVDGLELRHLVRVLTGCSLLLTDVYSDERIATIMQTDRSVLASLVGQLIDEQRRGSGEVLYRIRRLPDDVRVIGDKALFDFGFLGLRRVKGYELGELGARAYRAAGEALELLAEDRRLREFFRQNKLLMLPLEEEVGFLRQCADRFPLYAEILRTMHPDPQPAGRLVRDLAARVPLMAAVADAVAAEAAPEAPEATYVEAARGDADAGALFSRDELLSAYERMLLFASLDIGRLRDALNAIVVDQRTAVEALCDEFSLCASGTRDLRKPPGYFLVGPTGVGKNHLVECLGRVLEASWGVEIPILTIEGPNYTYPSDINELRGATRGFIRSDEEGVLSAFQTRAAKAPVSIILVDEVEKAHAQLRMFFLSILDRGTTTDNRGRVLNFANALVFFTSNLGYSDAQQRGTPIGYADDDTRQLAADADVRADLRRALSPEFVNRVRLIHFNRLSESSAERILDLEFERIARRYRDVHDLEIVLDPGARAELLRRGFSPAFGARRLAVTLEAVCNVAVSQRIRRDDRRGATDRDAVVARLRQLREGNRPFDANEIRREVLAHVRAALEYPRLRVAFREGEFRYEPEGVRA
ncbi:MAG TPA: AAA family ATPase [Candidatus Polarisedimenticolaceae bacterium]|nr:AAA family ATPase [Candidatus Polarisedimenticolaceae bacterium]